MTVIISKYKTTKYKFGKNRYLFDGSRDTLFLYKVGRDPSDPDKSYFSRRDFLPDWAAQRHEVQPILYKNLNLIKKHMKTYIETYCLYLDMQSESLKIKKRKNRIYLSNLVNPHEGRSALRRIVFFADQIKV